VAILKEAEYTSLLLLCNNNKENKKYWVLPYVVFCLYK
jgi:hypothetical protein